MAELYPWNQTTVAEFIILGFADPPQLGVLLYPTFLLLYLTALLGNLTLLFLLCVDTRLHRPMYYFLSQLSLVDIGYTSVTYPSMLLQMLTRKNTMPFSACMVQLYFFLSFAAIECLILTVMAVDRYLAICHPLRYTSLMTQRTCCWLIITSWTVGFLEAILYTVLISSLHFCANNHINHFFCDMTELLKLACGDTYWVNVATYILGTLTGFPSFLLTLTSYTFIISAILKMPSKEGRHRAFSTCASHLTVVVLFYLTFLCVYMKHTSAYSVEEDKLIAVLYTVIIPTCNPLIYSLRNADVQRALRRATAKGRAFFSNAPKTTVLSLVGNT